jgi:hypothetical protein
LPLSGRAQNTSKAPKRIQSPDWVTPAGPPPTGDEDELVVEEATLFE